MGSTQERLCPLESRRLAHGLARDELAGVCAGMGVPAYRARQIWHWLYIRRAAEWAACTSLPTDLRRALGERLSLASATVLGVEGDRQGTRKILVRLPDGERVESVLIPAGPDEAAARGAGQEGRPAVRRTVCVSTQAGCRFHCAFCASGQAGFRRDLDAGEIVGQVLAAWDCWADKPTHVVFMGIGEPLDNVDAVLKAVRILNDHDGLNIGARRLTLSTCGIVPGIERLAGEGIQVELSVSLHAPTAELRSELMPVNRRYPLPDLIRACREYTAKTNRIVTFEYVLIAGVNDAPQHARALVGLLAGWPCRVNLIPLSPVEEYGGRPSAPAAADAFIRALAAAGINATLRASRGASLKAACGQLRYRQE